MRRRKENEVQGEMGRGKRQREVQGGEEERDKMIEIEEQMKKMKVRRGARG